MISIIKTTPREQGVYTTQLHSVIGAGGMRSRAAPIIGDSGSNLNSEYLLHFLTSRRHFCKTSLTHITTGARMGSS